MTRASSPRAGHRRVPRLLIAVTSVETERRDSLFHLFKYIVISTRSQKTSISRESPTKVQPTNFRTDSRKHGSFIPVQFPVIRRKSETCSPPMDSSFAFLAGGGSHSDSRAFDVRHARCSPSALASPRCRSPRRPRPPRLPPPRCVSRRRSTDRNARRVLDKP